MVKLLQGVSLAVLGLVLAGTPLCAEMVDDKKVEAVSKKKKKVHHKAHAAHHHAHHHHHKKADVVEKKDPVATEVKEASPLGLEISGGTTVTGYVFRQTQRETGNGNGRGTHMQSDDSRVNFEVLGKAGPELDGLEYSFLIGIAGNEEAGKSIVEENRIKLKNRYGTMLLGGHRGVTDFMAVGAFNFHAGTGNVLGNYKNILNPTTGAVIKDDPAGHGKDATKITYVTPRIANVQLGYSFTPDANHAGEAKVATKAVRTTSGVVVPSGQHLHEIGLNFKRDFVNGFGLQLSATALAGKAKGTERFIALGHKDIASQAYGFVMSYAGVSVGAEYLDNGRSLEWKGLRGNNAGKVYNFGVGYTQGRHVVSLGYLTSKRNLGTRISDNVDFGKSTAKVGSLSYDYNLAKGLKVYAEGTLFNNKTSSLNQAGQWAVATTGAAASGVVGNNRGHAVMLGSAISF